MEIKWSNPTAFVGLILEGKNLYFYRVLKVLKNIIDKK